jgi:hypothetical protein
MSIDTTSLFEPHFDGGLVARHEAMLVVGVTVAEAVVSARLIHARPAEVELAHERVN